MTLRTFLMGGLFQVQEVNPEFLAALPPKIQEEVLAQQRLEQQWCSTAQVEKTTIALKLKFTKSRWTQPPQWTQGSSFKPCLLAPVPPRREGGISNLCPACRACGGGSKPAQGL